MPLDPLLLPSDTYARVVIQANRNIASPGIAASVRIFTWTYRWYRRLLPLQSPSPAILAKNFATHVLRAPISSTRGWHQTRYVWVSNTLSLNALTNPIFIVSMASGLRKTQYTHSHATAVRAATAFLGPSTQAGDQGYTHWAPMDSIGGRVTVPFAHDGAFPDDLMSDLALCIPQDPARLSTWVPWITPARIGTPGPIRCVGTTLPSGSQRTTFSRHDNDPVTNLPEAAPIPGSHLPGVYPTMADYFY